MCWKRHLIHLECDHFTNAGEPGIPGAGLSEEDRQKVQRFGPVRPTPVCANFVLSDDRDCDDCDVMWSFRCGVHEDK